MKPALLKELNTARANKERICLARNLATHESQLIRLGDHKLADALHEAVAEAHRQDRSKAVEIDGTRWFLQIFNPPLRLVVVGAVHISQALAPMAKAAGYDVTIIDPRRAFASAARFPDIKLIDDWPDDAMAALAPDRRTAVVTLTHDPKIDDPALDEALKTDAFYIAALGSRRTHASRVQRLSEAGHSTDAIARIHGPAGLDINAITPAEIAVSVMAEMTQALRRKIT